MVTVGTIFTRFYNAMAGPTLILNTTQFGHADLLDELEAGANEVGDKNRDGDDCDYVHDGDDGDSDDHSMSLRIDHHVSDNPLLQGRWRQRQIFLQVPFQADKTI